MDKNRELTPSGSNSTTKGASGPKVGKTKDLRDQNRSKARSASSSAVQQTSCTPEEAAFALDRIIESVFRLLSLDDLFSSRLVSRRWNLFASTELQKKVSITLSPPHHELGPSLESLGYGAPPPFKKLYESKADVNSSLEISIENLIYAMNNSTHFPSSTFKLYTPLSLNANYYDAINAQSFFDAHGFSIKKLQLCDENYRYNNVCRIHFKDLKRILLKQAPNLEHLILGKSVVIAKPEFYDEESDGSIFSEDEEEEEDQDFSSPLKGEGGDGYGNESDDESEDEMTLIDANAPPASKIELKLRVLEIKKKIPEKLLQEILDSAPKLQEVKMARNQYLTCLLKPCNRLHLLKTLQVDASDQQINWLEAFLAQNLDPNAETWAVETLFFDSKSTLSLNKHLQPKASAVMSKILQGVTPSLKKVIWGQMECLKGLVVPPMPQVTELILTARRFKMPQNPFVKAAGITGLSTRFFPSSVSLKETFPNLKCVRIMREFQWERDDGKGIKITQIFNDLEPVLSVKEVVLDDTFKLQGFKPMFPNASFSRSSETLLL